MPPAVVESAVVSTARIATAMMGTLCARVVVMVLPVVMRTRLR